MNRFPAGVRVGADAEYVLAVDLGAACTLPVEPECASSELVGLLLA